MKLIKHPVLKGYVQSSGFFFPSALMSQDVAISRLVAIWKPGSKIYGSDIGYILMSPQSSWVNCRQTQAAALVKQKNIYTSGLFSDDEIISMNLPVHSALIIDHGKHRIVPCSPDQLEHPASWIDLSDYQTIENLSSLGAYPPAPELKTRPVKKSLDSIFEKPLPKAVQERDAILEMFEKRKKTKLEKKCTKSGTRYARYGSFGWLRFLGPFFKHPSSSARPGNKTSYGPKEGVHRGPTWFNFILGHLIKTTGLWYLFSNSQSRYFKKMIEMFEEGDLKNGLRHAIPLSKTGEMTPDLPAWLSPKPRSGLTVSPHPAKGRARYTFEDSLYRHIHQLYEKAFEKLDGEGRIEEAVFILAELLQDSERAVSYLEQKGRLIEAAELAESRDLSPGLMIRQWFIAGKIERAIWIARKTLAFDKAVIMLERTHAQLASKLRLLWAKFLAQAGRYEEAVVVLWKIKEARHLAEDWIERAIAFGGINGARLLAYRAAFRPDQFMDSCQRLGAILKDTDSSMAIARTEFADALIKQPATPETQALGRIVFRPLFGDRARSKNLWPKKRFEELLNYIHDGALKADFQRTPFPDATSGKMAVSALLDRRSPPMEVTFSDFGSTEIYDFCVLPEGRSLVALGEAGVLVMNAKGKAVWHFNVPAHSFVVSDLKNRALALSPRGEVYRVSRIFIDEQKAAFWHEAKLDTYADTFDGSIWFAAEGENLFAIDVQDKTFKSFWHVSNLPGSLSRPCRSATSLAFMVNEDDHAKSLWRYDLPNLILRHRDYLEELHDKIILDLSVSASGTVKMIHIQEAPDENQSIFYLQANLSKKCINIPLNMAPGKIHPIAASEEWFAIPLEDEFGMTIYLVDQNNPKIRMCLKLPNTKSARIRFFDNEMTICDDQGRLIRMDLYYGAIVRSLSV